LYTYLLEFDGETNNYLFWYAFLQAFILQHVPYRALFRADTADVIFNEASAAARGVGFHYCSLLEPRKLTSFGASSPEMPHPLV
jgi:hypothetical protein